VSRTIPRSALREGHTHSTFPPGAALAESAWPCFLPQSALSGPQPSFTAIDRGSWSETGYERPRFSRSETVLRERASQRFFFEIRVVGVQSVGTVQVWHREEGWGVIDCPDTPGGCFVHFSHLWNDSMPTPGPGESLTSGYREAVAGEIVDFDWQRTSSPGSQDGYSFIAIWARPRGRQAPHHAIRRTRVAEQPNP
jgi:CspA family cold shock protein